MLDLPENDWSGSTRVVEGQLISVGSKAEDEHKDDHDGGGQSHEDGVVNPYSEVDSEEDKRK